MDNLVYLNVFTNNHTVIQSVNTPYINSVFRKFLTFLIYSSMNSNKSDAILLSPYLA